MVRFPQFPQLLELAQSFWRRSIRHKLVLAFGLMAVVQVGCFSYLMYAHQRSFLYDVGKDRAEGLAHALAASSTSWVLANDLGGLQEVLRGFGDVSDLKFAMVVSLRGEILGSSIPSQAGRYISDPVSVVLLQSVAEPVVLLNQHALIDVAVPIRAGSRHIGWARVEMTRGSSNAHLLLLGLAGFSFFLVTIVSVMLVSLWLANYLTRGLYHLMSVTQSIEQGRRDVRANIAGEDEVGRLAQGFNRMLDAMSDFEQRLERAAKVFEHSKEGIVVTDALNRIISVNRSFTQITGYDPEEVLGRDPKVLASGRQSEEFYRQMWNALNYQGNWQGELWNRRKSGELYPESLTIISVKDENNQVVNYIAIFGDISERKQAEARIQQLAHYDPLTGLPNRALFSDRLSQAIIQAQRAQGHAALLFLDLDRFKQINDTLGHDAGDQLLQLVAQRLQECMREQDTVSRQGGDEFLAILPGTGIAGAEMLAGKVLQAITRPCVIDGHELRISSSIGIAVYPDHAPDATTLVKYADVAMYQAKETGRNHYLVFDLDMNASAYERLRLESSLRAAIEADQFELYYQPQINLHSGHIIGCEALVRWHHPDLGMVSPASFIALAEETGLIGPISDWVLEEAVRQCRAWRDAGLQDLVVSVNLSALQFQQRDLHAQIKGLLERYDVPPSALDLELTESILMQGVERTLSTLHHLTELGVGTSIDDFGTGYSSLSYLKRFPLQTLKIDQSFVRDVTIDSNDATMVSTIILMAHSLKLAVIAEGVETEEQAEFLRQAGCERAQGYLYGRPMPADQFSQLLR